MSMEQQLREAMARGYCTPENSSKEMDSVLIDAMIKEILISVGFMPKDESRLVETEVSPKLLLYCIEVERESEEQCTLHHKFEKEPTREEILQIVLDAVLNYDDDCGRINYYQVK